MSYGTSPANGFVPFQSSIPANPNMQFNENFTIASGYANNIGKGDLVYVNQTTGCLQNVFDTTGGATSTFVVAGGVVGVFQGVFYSPPASTQQTYTGAKWSDAWYAGQVTRTGFPAKARILPVNQDWQFTIATGQTQIAAPTPSAPNPIKPTFFLKLHFVLQGTSTTITALNADGSSQCFVDAATPVTYNSTTANLVQFLGWDPNPPTGYPQISLPYGNVLVRICDTQLPLITA